MAVHGFHMWCASFTRFFGDHKPNIPQNVKFGVIQSNLGFFLLFSSSFFKFAGGKEAPTTHPPTQIYRVTVHILFLCSNTNIDLMAVDGFHIFFLASCAHFFVYPKLLQLVWLLTILVTFPFLHPSPSPQSPSPPWRAAPPPQGASGPQLGGNRTLHAN